MSLLLQFALPLCSAECPRAGGTAALALGGLSQNLSCRNPSLAPAEGGPPSPDLSAGLGTASGAGGTFWGGSGGPPAQRTGWPLVNSAVCKPVSIPGNRTGKPGTGGLRHSSNRAPGGRGICATPPSMQITARRLVGGRGQALRRGYKSGGETMHPPSRLRAWCGWDPQHRVHRSGGLPTFIYGAGGTPFLSRAAVRNEWCPLFFSAFCHLPPLHAEMEFDSYQHYFYDHDAQEDFHRSTAPSEDIWKKFELVPTPPLSPLGTPGEKGCCSGADERSGCFSRYCLAGEEPEYLIGTGEIFGNLSAFILKDCMWSGFSARERLEKAMTEKLSTGTQRATPHKPSFAQDFGFSSSVSECVDPAAVFLCPLAESKIPASSGSEGQSDSGKGWRCRAGPGAALLQPAGSPAWRTRVSTHVCAGSLPGSAFVAVPSESRSHEQSGLGCAPSRGAPVRKLPAPRRRGRGAPPGRCVGLW